MEKLMRNFPADKPILGELLHRSGANLAAIKDIGAYFIGIEPSADYIATAHRRLESQQMNATDTRYD